MGAGNRAAAEVQASKGKAMKLRRGEIWLVDLEPIRRGELGKTRPCLIVSDNEYNDSTSVPLVMPITSYGPTARSPGIFMTRRTGLSKDSSVLPLHIRAVAKSRFVHRIGHAPEAVIERAVDILVLVVQT